MVLKMSYTVHCTLYMYAYRNWWAGNNRLSWKPFKQAKAADHPVFQNSLWKGKYFTTAGCRLKRGLLPSTAFSLSVKQMVPLPEKTQWQLNSSNIVHMGRLSLTGGPHSVFWLSTFLPPCNPVTWRSFVCCLSSLFDYYSLLHFEGF